MSMIKRLQSEAAAQRTERQVVSEAGLKSLEMVDDLQGKWNKQFDEITRLEADVKATRKRADNKVSQYAILKNQYDDIKKRHDELESKERGLKESNEQMLKELGVEQKLGDRLKKQCNDIEKRHDDNEKRLDMFEKKFGHFDYDGLSRQLSRFQKWILGI